MAQVNMSAQAKGKSARRGPGKTLNLMQVVALAHKAQDATALDYHSRWERLRQGDPYPAVQEHNPSSIKQNKTWYQLGDGPRRLEVNYFDYDPVYYRPWYIRQGPAPLTPVYHHRYQRGPAGGVYFHYTTH